MSRCPYRGVLTRGWVCIPSERPFSLGFQAGPDGRRNRSIRVEYVLSRGSGPSRRRQRDERVGRRSEAEDPTGSPGGSNGDLITKYHPSYVFSKHSRPGRRVAGVCEHR